MTDIIAMLSSTFLISSFVPALIFVSLNVLFLPLFLGESIDRLIVWPSESFNLIPWVVLVIATAVGYLLTSQDTRVIDLYQGYPLLKIKPLKQLVTRCPQKKWCKLKQRVNDSKEAHDKEVEDEELRDELFLRYCEQLAEFRRYYPRDLCNVMPTKLGNIFSAYESECLHRYGIDQNAIWPLLYPAVSKDYKRIVIDSNTLIQFLLNLSLLSFIFTGEVLLCWAWGKLGHLDTAGTAALLLAPPLSGIGLYYLSIPVACTYGDYIFGCISLFRHQLLKDLNIRLPTKLDEERVVWKSLADFLSMGEGDPFGHFVYPPLRSGSVQTASDNSGAQ